MNPIQHILDTYPLIVLDGAMATELERKGCDLNDSLWSAKILLEEPNLIKHKFILIISLQVPTVRSPPAISLRLRALPHAG